MAELSVKFEDTINKLLEEKKYSSIRDILVLMAPSDRTYLHSSPLYLFKHRIVWLMLLMISATFTRMIITGFESALAVQVVLTAFIPMLMDTGGNSGSQSSVTIIRAISLGEIEFHDLPRVFLKEITTALMCGLVLAFVCFGKVMLVVTSGEKITF